jgi:hypothetical protein
VTWLAHLSFAQAVRWAALWPTLLVLTAAFTVALGAAVHWQDDWAFAFGVSSTGRLPIWLAVTLSTGLVLFAPSLAFLALWSVVHR